MAALSSSTSKDVLAESPWYAAYPSPKTAPASVHISELCQWLKDGKKAGKDFLLIDLRRNDFEVVRAEQIL